MMKIRHHMIAASCFGLAALAGCRPAAQPAAPAATGQEAAATFGASQVAPRVVDSQAVQILRRSMDYLNGLQRFSAKTQILTEDQLNTGNRVDYESWGSMTVERPDKLRGERHGVGFQQTLLYDGTNLTLYDATRQVYATKPAPGMIPGMFQLAYDSLGLSVPISDLVWPDVFPLLVQGVTLARVMDKEIIGGVICDHLVFSRPDVDFQIWIPDAGDPLPMKYIVTDPATPAMLSIVTTLSDWKVNQHVPAATFTFVPPKGAQPVPFLNPDTGI
jgi:hypothetical protein